MSHRANIVRVWLGVCLAVAAGLWLNRSGASQTASAPAEIAVTVENPATATRPAGAVTFGMVFARGDLPRSVTVRGLPTQADVKRRWPDGSIKHAVLTALVPDLPAGAARRLVLVDAPQRQGPASAPRALPEALGDVEVRLALHGGPTVTASLRKARAAGPPERTWLAGGQVLEQHFRMAPADEKGQADPDLEVRFDVRYYEASGSARVACVVENCHWLSPGNLPYDVTILADGREVFARAKVGTWPKEKAYLGHPKGARWVQRFWLGRALDDAHVRYERPYLNRTGLLPRYDEALEVPEKVLADAAAAWAKVPRDILQNGLIHPYFPNVGGRPDLGPLPLWTGRYLLSQDRRALATMLGVGDLGGGCPVHLRDPASGRYISLDEHPRYSHNDAGTGERIRPRPADTTPYVLPPGSHFAVDTSHQPSLAYVPYLVAGDYYYLEEMQFWANWCMVQHNHGYRQGASGLLTRDQVRGTGWALRQLTHAAALSPDDDPFRPYFEAKLANNIAHLRDYVEGRLARKPTAIGTYTLGASFGYTRGWPEQADKYYSMAGWMHNFLTWSLANTVNMGYEDAAPVRDYLMKFTIGSFTHPQDCSPMAGTAYFLLIGKQEQGADRWFQTWKEVADGTFHRTDGTPAVAVPERVSYPTYGGSYSYIARGVLLEALRAQQPGAAEALRWLEEQLPDRQKVLAADPTWAFARPQEKP